MEVLVKSSGKFVCVMESSYKNISKICDVTFIFQNFQMKSSKTYKKLKKFTWIWKYQ